VINLTVEKRRGCGYRQIGGLYLCGMGKPVSCDRLPYILEICPTCGQGIKFSRGFSWIDAFKFFGIHEHCNDLNAACPVCTPEEGIKYGLVWIGKKYYTPGSFTSEAIKMGVSKRIATVPKDLKLGETWVLVAHPEAGKKEGKLKKGQKTIDNKVPCPAIFYAFVPTRVEMIITKKQTTKRKLKQLKKRGITPVIVPDNDLDHNTRKKMKLKKKWKREFKKIKKPGMKWKEFYNKKLKEMVKNDL